jgi:hypothetical protein
MSTDESNRAGLWSLVAQLLNERYFAADAQTRKPAIEDALVVKEHLTLVERFEKTVTCLRKKPHNPGVRSLVMGFDVPAAAVNELLKLPLHLVERLVNQAVQIALSGIHGTFALDCELAPGQSQVNAYRKCVALLVVAVRLIDDHSTTRDAVVRGFQPRYSRFYGRLNDG